MTRFEDVNIPEALFEAQSKGRLAIFAGAGVSMPLPSNYPNLANLANAIGAGVLAREDDEPDDRFLGRLVRLKVPVHERVKRILSDPLSKPNDLHESVVKLFAPNGSLYLVTTNFDSHFTTIARKLAIPGDIYRAPALPPGDRFKGIVYLHGSVEGNAEDLVLTDSDFGRAYLTEGWATRFLQTLFITHTVLFVGYSHNDTVMRYLARGLPADSSRARYALTETGLEDHWRFLGITPVSYSPENDHFALQACFRKWSERCSLGPLDHERRIREIVTKPPPLDQEVNDYLRWAITDPTSVQFFVRHAKTPEWLRWVVEAGLFTSLLQPGNEIDECSRQLAYWYAGAFTRNHPEDALAVLEKHDSHLHHCLWEAIANTIWPRRASMTGDALAKWVTILLRTSGPLHGEGQLCQILRECKRPEDMHTAVILFDYLSRPRFDLKRLWMADPESGRQVHWETSVGCDAYELQEAWNDICKPNLSLLVDRLDSIITCHVTQAHFGLRSVKSADEEWDPCSFSQQTVEGHDPHPSGLSVLVEAARDVIEWLLAYKPAKAVFVITSWAESGVPLLKRLAIHGMAQNVQATADDKINWVIDRGFIHGYGLKHEVFMLLRDEYPKASVPCRKRLLGLASSGYRVRSDDQEAKEIRAYEVYNLLFWLHNADPTCTHAKRRLASIVKKHPQFAPRESPDLDFSTGASWVGRPSPISVSELLASDPAERLDWLLTYQGDGHPLGPKREGLLEAIAQSVGQSFDWAWKLMLALEETQSWLSDLWNYLFLGLEKGQFSPSQWRKVLGFVLVHPELHVLTRTLSSLLESLVHGESPRLPSSAVGSAERLAEKVWDACSAASDQPSYIGSTWVDQALNHAAGTIALFWVGILSLRRTKAGDDWTGIPPRHKNVYEKMIVGTSLAAQFGRVIIASQVRFLLAADEPWTTVNVLPLFRWSTDAKKAEQAWHGYLVWGKPNEGLVRLILPSYREAFAHLSTGLEPVRNAFNNHLALMAVYGSGDPLQENWLMEFMAIVGIEDKKNWVFNVGNTIDAMEPSAIENLWTKWLSRYWTLRNEGIPIPLDASEQEEMIHCWLPHLGPVFPDAAAKASGGPAPVLTRTWVFHRFAEAGFAERYPESLAPLLLRLLEGTSDLSWDAEDAAELLRRLIPTKASREVLHRICDELARLGYPGAVDLDSSL